MSDPAELDHAIELLDRALGYTRGILAAVDADPPALSLRTPCHGWDLGQLLAHMEDALDAFIEGARGSVSLEPRIPAVARTEALRQKACALLEAWSRERPALVEVGDKAAPTSVVAAAAALEITVHGWDVAQAIGRPTPIPDELAASLLPVADALVATADRGPLFAARLEVPDDSSAEVHLLAFLGRDRSMPLASFQDNPSTGPRIAS
ncbi:MAG: TIGR03086 family metal-binding protein [Actinomycetota bacterium]|nr:TIGR03086 family metal-binding protein [Actinomycetota bacterium]